ncbi:hypothetical protein [Ferrimicrobium sp.]|nr:hypothetical protein [Ferrimicrobium sp.]
MENKTAQKVTTSPKVLGRALPLADVWSSDVRLIFEHSRLVADQMAGA